MKKIARKAFTLRVRAGSEVDRLLDQLTDGIPHTDEEAKEVGGLSRSWMVARQWLPMWFDNVTLDMSRGSDEWCLNYIDVRPDHIEQRIENAAFNVVKTQADNVDQTPEPVDAYGELIWAEAPPSIVKMENFREPSFFQQMKTIVDAGRHVSLEGPPGIGKSTSVEQLAAEEGIPLVNVSADAGLRRRDLTGTTEMVGGTTKFLVAEYATAVVSGWWVKIDEINAADPDAIMFLNSQMAPPYVINIHGQQYPVHPNFRLFVTYNAGLIGTKPLPPAFKDRFYPIKVEFPTEFQLRKMLEMHGLPTERNGWDSTMLLFASKMWDAHTRGVMRYQISPRRLIDAIYLVTVAGSSVVDAIKAAVIAAIDSPVESKAAESILLGVNNAVL